MVFATRSFAQKEIYDVVSYTVPNGWKKEVKENGVQLYTGDEKTGEYSVALIIHSTESGASAGENFSSMWEKLVKGTVTVSTEPTMAEPLKDKGWDIISGQAHYTDGANNGVVMLVTATGNGKLATVVLMTNTDKYQQELQSFLHAMELSPIEAGKTPSSIVGVWEGSSKEKFTGGTMNGYNTGGFFTYQYKFGADGSYQFAYVGASAYTDANVLQYEKGTYSVTGDQLTIQPVSGSNEEWGVVGGPVKLSAMSDVQIDKIKRSWGKKLKSGPRKLEKYVYTFKVEYMEGNHANALIVQYDSETVREGKGGKSYYFEVPVEKSTKLPGAK